MPICLSELPSLDMRVSADGTWHGVWRTIGADHRFYLSIPPPSEAATVAAAGVDPCDAAPDHWRHVHNRIATGEEPRGYTAERHRAWLKRREIER